MSVYRVAGWMCALVLVAGLAGCSGQQSALSAMGREAARIDPLFWTATAVALMTTLVVIVVLVIVLYGPPAWRRRLSREWVIIGGGIVFPVTVLSALLVYGFFVMQAGAVRNDDPTELTVTVTGKRWWWDVVYTTSDGRRIRSANELRLPVGEPVRVRLKSDNVIHSFWAPRLAGKLDMIPGRTNEIVLEAEEPGISRGQCAEYCGGAHALMAFYVETMPEDQFDAWLENIAAPAREPESEMAARGHKLFSEYGCGACHRVRGTEATGTLGPDLTHVGGRLSLGAAILPNDREAFRRWIADNQHIKPDNLMPPFELPEEELGALAAYLDSLE